MENASLLYMDGRMVSLIFPDGGYLGAHCCFIVLAQLGHPAVFQIPDSVFLFSPFDRLGKVLESINQGGNCPPR
jgi:hypothetical protein